MGQEIKTSYFTEADLALFAARLRDETAILKDYFHDGAFAQQEYKAGFELEAWLLDQNRQVSPDNKAFLKTLANPDVVPELAAFNFEVNGAPEILRRDGLEKLYQHLLDNWRHCQQVAADRGEQLLMIGILPHLREQDLCVDNMSGLSRYKALNEQVLKMRNYEPLHLHIARREALDIYKDDVMMEAATTSFQVHFQIPLEKSASIYNASILASAATVAVAANSPFLFSLDLWDETRIPLFEQAVELGPAHQQRVSFGRGYLRESLFECFEENLADHSVLFPSPDDADPQLLSHVKLHNGTIWRWNRPLIDFDEGGKPHLRIEHRVVPAGPTIRDSMANAAFFYGLALALAEQYPQAERLMSFATAKANFYDCAKQGLDATLRWPEQNAVNVRTLILEQLLPLAEQGLRQLGINGGSIDCWLGIIRERAQHRQNGAAWQRQCVARHGGDVAAMVARYQELQQTEAPVHEWPV